MTTTIPYPPDLTPREAARTLDRLLEGDGWRVQRTWDEAGDEIVQVTRRDQPYSAKGLFRPGQQLVVEDDGTWRVENAVVTS